MGVVVVVYSISHGLVVASAHEYSLYRTVTMCIVVRCLTRHSHDLILNRSNETTGGHLVCIFIKSLFGFNFAFLSTRQVACLAALCFVLHFLLS